MHITSHLVEQKRIEPITHGSQWNYNSDKQRNFWYKIYQYRKVRLLPFFVPRKFRESY